MKRYFTRLLQHLGFATTRNQISQLETQTFQEIVSTPARKLPWTVPVQQMTSEMSSRYAHPWEARFMTRLAPTTEIASGFSHLEWEYARMLEYAWVARRTLSADDLLDVGSGPGDFPSRLARLAASVTAVDIQDFSDAHQTLRVREKVNYKWQVEDARKLSFPDATFDCVTSVSVIEHIPSPGDVAAVAEMVRVCKPLGRVILTFPYSHKCLIEDMEHPGGLQRFYDLATVFGKLVPHSVLVRDINFIKYAMPEDRLPPRFGYPEQAGVLTLCLERCQPSTDAGKGA